MDHAVARVGTVVEHLAAEANHFFTFAFCLGQICSCGDHFFPRSTFQGNEREAREKLEKLVDAQQLQAQRKSAAGNLRHVASEVGHMKLACEQSGCIMCTPRQVPKAKELLVGLHHANG